MRWRGHIKHNMRLTLRTCARCASSLISIRRPNVWPMSERSAPTFRVPPAREGASEAPALHQIVDQIFEIRVLILRVGSMRLLGLE